MVFPTAYVTALSSATLRVLAYIFFRWVALNLHSSLEQIMTPNPPDPRPPAPSHNLLCPPRLPLILPLHPSTHFTASET